MGMRDAMYMSLEIKFGAAQTRDSTWSIVFAHCSACPITWPRRNLSHDSTTTFWLHSGCSSVRCQTMASNIYDRYLHCLPAQGPLGSPFSLSSLPILRVAGGLSTPGPLRSLPFGSRQESIVNRIRVNAVVNIRTTSRAFSDDMYPLRQLWV